MSFSLALLADTLRAVNEDWGDPFPFLIVKEGGTGGSRCAVSSRGWRNRPSVFSAGALLGALVGWRSNISSANSVCLVPEHRSFALPGVSQAIAFNQSLKSIGVIMFMAQWLLLKVSVL